MKWLWYEYEGKRQRINISPGLRVHVDGGVDGVVWSINPYETAVRILNPVGGHIAEVPASVLRVHVDEIPVLASSYGLLCIVWKNEPEFDYPPPPQWMDILNAAWVAPYQGEELPGAKWHGEPIVAHRVRVTVKEPVRPKEREGLPWNPWYRHLSGHERRALRVTHNAHTWFMDDECGRASVKVLNGGWPNYGHSELPQ